MRDDHDNLRAALDHAIDRARRTGRAEDVDAGLRLADAMVWFWAWNLRYEGVAAISALLALPGGSAVHRALGLQALGVFHVHYPTPQSRAAAEESLTLFTELGDTRNAAVSRLVIAWAGQFGPDFERSWQLVRRAEADLDEGAEPGARVLLHYLKALLHLGQGTFDASTTEWGIALADARAIEHRVLQGAMSSHLGVALREAGRPAEAVDALRRAVETDERGGSLHGLAFALVHLAHSLVSSGDDAEAGDLLTRGDEVARRIQNPRCQAWAAWGRARLAVRTGRPDVALEECRRATGLFQNREYPWALVQLWGLLAETAAAAGEPDVAADARVQARRVLVTPGAGG